ncbi:hypothetical protein AAFF_G00281640 [Aldrovandia affinis]|uniref:Uncharacterized protein n=1 Tax=Aldrovandia affinis TaxID=143900 RepID=A0AAD7W1S3_9TELE|nr:hypothetical protein AAFF_G00281640 [Aldrovandia affinis]
MCVLDEQPQPARMVRRPSPPAQVVARLPLFAMPLCRNPPHHLSRRRALSASCGDLERLLEDNADEECTQTDLVQHAIDTGDAAPVRLRPHRLSLAKRLGAEEKVKEMAQDTAGQRQKRAYGQRCRGGAGRPSSQVTGCGSTAQIDLRPTNHSPPKTQLADRKVAALSPKHHHRQRRRRHRAPPVDPLGNGG